MHKITIRIYENGLNTFHTFEVRQQVTVTGNEDQMQYALDHARSIVAGIQWVKPDARIRVDKIELYG